MRGGPVAENRTRAARENRRHVVREQRWRLMTNGVDAAPHESQAPVCPPALDAVAVDARGAQLRRRDPAMLPARDPRDSVEKRAHTAR